MIKIELLYSNNILQFEKFLTNNKASANHIKIPIQESILSKCPFCDMREYISSWSLRGTKPLRSKRTSYKMDSSIKDTTITSSV